MTGAKDRMPSQTVDDVAFDPVAIEVARHKLEGIAEEMQQTLLRSSFSPIAKEGLDASACLFTAEGETLAQSRSIPIHLGTLIPVMKQIIETFPAHEMREGDAYILNEPYQGGTHLPDIAIVTPVYAGGRIIAYAATMMHHQDVGGLSPGSVPTNATEIFQEGLRIPPLLLFRDGKFNETLIAIIRKNVRIPETSIGDLNAQLAACKVGVRRLKEMASVGENQMISIFAELLRRSEKLTRAALARIPDGTYHYTDYNDNDGIDLDKPIRFTVAVTIKDGTFHCDFTGSSPQVRGPFNCVPSGTLAAACYAIRAVTDPDTMTNAGCFRPISLHLPEGSIVNPTEPAPVNARTATIKRIAGVILGALRQALPEKIPADDCGEMLALMFGGKWPGGKTFVIGELIGGGSGASTRSDGVDVIETDVTNCMNLPAESMEMEAPIRVHQIALRQGSGGDGEYRGGLGLIKEYEVLADEVRVTHRGERHYFEPRGANGGAAGAKAESVIYRGSGEEITIPSKLMETLKKGDRLVITTAGGGGNGDPADRAKTSRETDQRDGKVAVSH